DGGITGDVHHQAAGAEEERERILDEGQRGDRIDLEDPPKSLRGCLLQRGQGRVAQVRGVVHEEVQPTCAQGGRDQPPTVCLLPYISRDRDDVRSRGGDFL